MNLKTVLILVVVGAIAIASIMIVVSRNKTSVSPAAEKTSDELKTSGEVSTSQYKKYIDPSGFSFSYPVDLGFNSEELPSSSYANLRLTVPETDTEIKINVSDSKEKTIDSILKKRGITTETEKTILADLDAVQYKNATQTATLALDEGVLFEITLIKPDKSDAFDSAYNDLIASFAFQKPDASPASEQAPVDNSSSEDVVFEGEEVVE